MRVVLFCGRCVCYRVGGVFYCVDVSVIVRGLCLLLWKVVSFIVGGLCWLLWGDCVCYCGVFVFVIL